MKPCTLSRRERVISAGHRFSRACRSYEVRANADNAFPCRSGLIRSGTRREGPGSADTENATRCGGTGRKAGGGVRDAGQGTQKEEASRSVGDSC